MLPHCCTHSRGVSPLFLAALTSHTRDILPQKRVGQERLSRAQRMISGYGQAPGRTGLAPWGILARRVFHRPGRSTEQRTAARLVLSTMVLPSCAKSSLHRTGKTLPSPTLLHPGHEVNRHTCPRTEYFVPSTWCPDHDWPIESLPCTVRTVRTVRPCGIHTILRNFLGTDTTIHPGDTAVPAPTAEERRIVRDLMRFAGEFLICTSAKNPTRCPKIEPLIALHFVLSNLHLARCMTAMLRGQLKFKSLMTLAKQA